MFELIDPYVYLLCKPILGQDKLILAHFRFFFVAWFSTTTPSFRTLVCNYDAWHDCPEWRNLLNGIGILN
jgi:hypothetical protein